VSEGPVEVAWLDERGVIVAVNEAWRAFTEHSGGDPSRCGPGVSYLDVCARAGDATSAQVAVAIRAALAGRAVVPALVTVVCVLPTSEAWFDLVVYPRVDDGGRPVGAVVALWPVSASLAALRVFAGNVRDPLQREVWPILEDLPDGALLVDEGGCIAYATDNLLRLSGHRREELVDHPVEVLVPEAQRERHVPLQEAYRAQPHPRMMGQGLVLSLRHWDGHVVPVEISLAPLRHAGSMMVIAVVRDVSVLRAADRDRARLLRLLDLDPDAVYVVGADDGIIEYANSGAAHLLGYRVDELIGRPVSEISVSSGDDLRRQFVEQHRAAGPGYQHRLVVERIAKDGTRIPCDSSGQLVADGDRAVFIVVDRDARPRLAIERQRERQAALTELVGRVTTLVLSDAGADEAYQAIVDGAASLLDCDNASLILRDASSGELVTVAATGAAALLHRERVAPFDEQMLRAYMAQAEAFTLLAPSERQPTSVRERAGPGVVAPLPLSEGAGGLLSTFASPGAEPFTDEDARLLGELARQSVTVIELGRARAEEQRLVMLEERQRIARDLHDNVIQDLIGLGMQLTARDEGDELVDILEEAVRKLRMVVFDARQTGPARLVTKALASTVAEASRILGHHPVLAIEGPVDELPPVVTSQLFPALREALSNVARHAAATTAWVTVAVEGGRVRLVVEDDGVGPGSASVAGIGLSNLRERAASLGGDSTLSPRPSSGSRLEWTVRLPALVPDAPPAGVVGWAPGVGDGPERPVAGVDCSHERP
jgi:PAS domain S-box-containing protein